MVAGLGSWLLAVLPYLEGGMSVTVIALAVIGSALMIWGLTEKSQIRLKRSQLDDLIKNRKRYLLPIRPIIEERLKIADKLALEAGQYPHEEYQKRYLPFQRNKKPLAIQNALVRRKFMWNNQYYQLLKDRDEGIQSLIRDYDIYYAQIKDGKLKKHLKQLWKVEHYSNSLKAFNILAKGEKHIPHTVIGLNIAKIGENINKVDINNSISKVLTRIDELLDGEEDE